MGGLVQPGPQQALKPAPVPGSRLSTSFWPWFPRFLHDELKPYPGRLNLVLRYTVAATLTMLLITTFRIPGAASGGFFSLLVTRESPRATLRGGISSILAYAVGLVLVLCGALLFVNYPLSHFLWVAGSFFVAFFCISTLSNYGAATAFAISIVLSVPVWDGSGPQSSLIVSNLWTAASVALAILVAIFVEYIFSLFSTSDELIEGLTQRLDAVQKFFVAAASTPGDPKARAAARSQIVTLAGVGVSRLRRLALSDSVRPADAQHLSTTIAIVGRLIDLLAPFDGVDSFTEEQRRRSKLFADQIVALTHALRNPVATVVAPLPPSEDRVILFVSIGHTLELLRLSSSSKMRIDPAGNAGIVDPSLPSNAPLFKRDAFTNTEHLQFALRGCTASVLCYFLLNATFWPGLSTSLFTCVVTALSSIGSSRQKQLLRISGALCGGLILGLGSQVFLLPQLDTVAGFTMIFVAVTAVASWFLTSSPRISYFGTQMALAFYLIQLRGPFPQTDLAISRDNVMGILLGLMAMWLVFETLGSKTAVQVMRELFSENLELMSKLAKPWRNDKSTDFKYIRTLRDRISQNFAAVNSQADAVLFEVGRDRDRSLVLRQQLLFWQPELHSLVLMQAALLQYRLQVLPSQLPQPVLEAAYRFDDELSTLLMAISSALRRNPTKNNIAAARGAFSQLSAAFEHSYSDPPPRARAVLEVSSQILELASRLFHDVSSIV